MNCQEFEQVVSDLARGRLMEAQTRQQGQLHATACARCATRQEEERQLVRGLQHLAQADQRAHAPARVEANLVAALRRRHSESLREMPAATPKPLWARRLALVAAALAVAVLLPLGWWRGSAADETPALVAALPPVVSVMAWPVPDNVVEPTPTPALMKVFDPPRRAVIQPVALRPAPAVKKVTPRASPQVELNHPQEVVTQFFPLNNSDALPPTDELHQVRVQLPRSALADFGLPVNERDGARVTADVLIGADGLARAVRFVR